MIYSRHLLPWGVAAIALAGVSSCSDKWEMTDNADPACAVATDHIMTEPGYEIKLTGKVSDADGISSIRLSCPGILLNKTIDILEIYGEPKKEYDLDYRYRLPKEADGEDFMIDIEITDIGGNVTTRQVHLTLDGDFTAPIFEAVPDTEITVLIKDPTTFNLKFTVKDNREIDHIDVNLEGEEGFTVTIDGEGKSRIEYKKKIELPAKAAEYKLTLTAYDRPAQDGEVRSTTTHSVIKVSELPDFDAMYLADVSNVADLNSDVFGVPMAMDHVGPFQYRTRYYNRNAGTGVCFIPQRTDFLPICFGPDPDFPETLADDPEKAGRITLDKANTYYEFHINIKTGEYDMKSYPPADAIDPVMHMTYGADDLDTWENGGSWWQKWYFGPMREDNPREIDCEMEQDPKNPHIYVIEDYQLERGNYKMTLHNWHHDGWWNYTAWRVDDSKNPSKCMYYGKLHEDNDHFTGNRDYFQWKYIDCDQTEYRYMYPGAGAFNMNSWGSEDYRKKFVPDNKIAVKIPTTGSYRLIFDAHTEHIKLTPNF